LIYLINKKSALVFSPKHIRVYQDIFEIFIEMYLNINYNRDNCKKIFIINIKIIFNFTSLKIEISSNTNN